MRSPIITYKIFHFPVLRALLQILVALILLVQFPLLSRAQENYIPLAVEGAQWIVATGDMTTPWPVEYLWEYYAKGDTNINDIVYKKIYGRSLVTTQDPPPFIPNGDYHLKGLIRDDTIEKKVYAIDLFGSGEDFCPADEEFLMYDFSVEQGDTVGFCLLPDWETYMIDTIHQDVYNGFDTRRFQLLWMYENYFEGIGSDYGLFEPFFIPIDKAASNPLYYSYLYYYCRQAPCGLIVSVTDHQLSYNQIKIYPNPATSVLNIKLRTTETSGEISLFSIYGQELMQIKAERNKDEYSLDISDLPAGNYILTYDQEGVVLDTEKIIVSR